MKKFAAILLTLVMVVGTCVTAFAARGNFVKSPSENTAPELVDSKNSSHECTAEIVITPYSERNKLPEDLRLALEKAYNDIVDASNLAKLNGELDAIAKKLGVKTSDLAVSDLFDIRYISCAEHSGHGYFEIVLKSDTFKNFVALLHFEGNEWKIVEGAKTEEKNGEVHLSFKVDSLSPFAVVVNTANSHAPTGDNTMIYVYIAIISVCAVALVFLAVKSRKQKA